MHVYYFRWFGFLWLKMFTSKVPTVMVLAYVHAISRDSNIIHGADSFDISIPADSVTFTNLNYKYFVMIWTTRGL